LLPTGDKSRHRRYSSRKAIALWILISASFWLVLGLVLSIVFDGGGDQLEAEGKHLSKIAPAAGGASSKP
jgi:hypothetical protein